MRTISIVLINLFLFSCANSSKSSSTNNYSQKTEKTENQDCVEFIALVSAKDLAREFGWTESYVLQNHRVNVWEKTTSNGRGRVVGEMYPGSNARILDRSGDDFKIVSPLDNSIGWVNEVQVDRTHYQNPNTYEKCRK